MKPITKKSKKVSTTVLDRKTPSAHRTISEQAPTNQEIIDSYDYLSSAASAWDCTGLIPSAPSSSAELESYEAIYPFEPPKLDSDQGCSAKHFSAYTGEKQE